MKGSAAVVDALTACYACAFTAFEQFHRQEHRFERQEYQELEDWYDSLVHDARGWRRKLLKRLEMFRAEFDSVLNPFQVGNDAPTAISYTLKTATDLHDEIQVLSDAATADRDLKTQKIALGIQGDVQHLITKCEALLEQIELIGHEQWLGHKTGKL